MWRGFGKLFLKLSPANNSYLIEVCCFGSQSSKFSLQNKIETVDLYPYWKISEITLEYPLHFRESGCVIRLDPILALLLSFCKDTTSLLGYMLWSWVDRRVLWLWVMDKRQFNRHHSSLGALQSVAAKQKDTVQAVSSCTSSCSSFPRISWLTFG